MLKMAYMDHQCALLVESAEPTSTPAGDSFVFLDPMGEQASVERFPAGFDGSIFLVAQGRTIIKHRGFSKSPREYVAWRDGLDFNPRLIFKRVVGPRIEPDEDLGLGQTFVSSQDISTNTA
jgi:hypothetical protein